MFIRCNFEILLIKIAIYVLSERNVPRSMVVSRRDNNDMQYMSDKLESVVKRMADKYNHI